MMQEIQQLRGQLSNLYNQPRTPMIQEVKNNENHKIFQEIANYERRLQYLQSQIPQQPPPQGPPQQGQPPQQPGGMGFLFVFINAKF